MESSTRKTSKTGDIPTPCITASTRRSTGTAFALVMPALSTQVRAITCTSCAVRSFDTCRARSRLVVAGIVSVCHLWHRPGPARRSSAALDHGNEHVTVPDSGSGRGVVGFLRHPHGRARQERAAKRLKIASCSAVPTLISTSPTSICVSADGFVRKLPSGRRIARTRAPVLS